jgi:hypothetical protein
VPVREQRCVDLATEYTDSIHIVLILKPLDQTIVPPRSQAFQRLDYVITQKVSIRLPADYLNYRQTTQPLAQDYHDLPAKITHLDQPQHSEQAAVAEQDSYFRQDAHVEQG